VAHTVPPGDPERDSETGVYIPSSRWMRDWALLAFAKVGQWSAGRQAIGASWYVAQANRNTLHRAGTWAPAQRLRTGSMTWKCSPCPGLMIPDVRIEQGKTSRSRRAAFGRAEHPSFNDRVPDAIFQKKDDELDLGQRPRPDWPFATQFRLLPGHLTRSSTAAATHGAPNSPLRRTSPLKVDAPLTLELLNL
jgi:hypothetical protein